MSRSVTRNYADNEVGLVISKKDMKSMAILTVDTDNDGGLDDFNSGTLMAETADGDGLSLREAVALFADGDDLQFDNSLIGSIISLLNPLVISEDITFDGDINNDMTNGDITITNTNDTNAISIVDDGVTFTNAGATISVDSSNLSNPQPVVLAVDADDVTFVNEGALNSTGFAGGFAGDGSTGIQIDGDNFTFTNEASGSVVSNGRFAVASVFVDTASGGSSVGTTITNHGVLQSEDDVIRIYSGTINNTGSIVSNGTFAFPGQLVGEFVDGLSIGIGQAPMGFVVPAAGLNTINNSFGGLISGPRVGTILTGSGTVNNDGEIEGGVGGIFVQGDFNNLAVQDPFTLDNGPSGAIRREGDNFGFNDNVTPAAVFLGSGLGAITIENSGLIVSTDIVISSFSGVDLLVNNGGQLLGDSDAAGDDAVAFRGSAVADFLVEAEIFFLFPQASLNICLLYTSPSPRDRQKSRMPSSA